MALRLGDLVVRGEIFNTARYSVHGWLELRGWDHPMMLQLTGNCDPDLAGWHFRFEAQGGEDSPDGNGESDSGGIDLAGVARQQVGPTGIMTATRKVKVCDCSPRELYLRCKLDEPPPFEWKRCLYLEWFSQNGRVVIDLADPRIEFVEFVEPTGVSTGELAARAQTEQSTDPAKSTNGPAAPPIPADEKFGAVIYNSPEADSEEEPDEEEDEEEPDEEEDDPYGLFPKEMERQFDAEAYQIDRALEDDEAKSQDLREMELMDDLIENSPGEPLVTIFDDPVRLPRPDQLGDEEAEEALKSLLAELALFGIALDICEHFTPREAYRLLVEEICPEERAYPELRNTQWVQCFSTSDFCEACEAEFDREFEEHERRRKENPSDDPPADDDIPF